MFLCPEHLRPRKGCDSGSCSTNCDWYKINKPQLQGESMECPRCQNSTRPEGRGVFYCYDCRKYFYTDKDGNIVVMED